MPDKRDGKITSLDQILDKYLARHGLLGKSRQMLAALVWAEVVGPWYSRHTAVSRVHDGILTVHCDSAPRAQQLQLDSDKILGKLNQHLGGNHIKEIRATSGRLGRGSRGPSLPTPAPESGFAKMAPKSLSAGQEQAIQDLAGEIAELELREIFVAVMGNFCRLEHWKRDLGYNPCPHCGRLIEQGKPCPVCYPGRQS